jgi:basic membrane protein A
MSIWKKLSIFGVTALTLAACGNGADEAATSDEGEASSEDTDFSIAMVTDMGGVDDRSFNQSAWEGMQAWAEENNFSEDTYRYYQSDSETDFIPNFNSAMTDGFDIIFGIGFLLEDPIATIAEQNPDQYLALVDGIVEAPNVASLNFRDHENAFLAGMAAALTTETGTVGFLGGMESPIIDRFQTGYQAGVEYVDDSIEVDIQYANSFDDAGAGQQIAAAMFTNQADVIFQAAGASGNGVFTEARNRMEAGSDTDLWVIGVDRDQHEEGEYEGGNLTLASTIKQVGNAVKNVSNQAMEGDFPGGETVYYGFAEEGIDFVQHGNISEENWALIEEARQDIIDGDIVVPEFTYSE